jgi:hypothetical protein
VASPIAATIDKGDDRVDSGDAHQALDVVSPEGDAGEVAVDE